MVGAPDLARAGPERQVGAAQDFSDAGRGDASGAAHERFEACMQFGQGKRFDEVVVHASREAVEAVFQTICRGEHEHGEGARETPAEVLADFQAVEPGEAAVEHDDG